MISMVMTVCVEILDQFTWFAVNTEGENIVLRPRQFNIEVGKARVVGNASSSQNQLLTQMNQNV